MLKAQLFDKDTIGADDPLGEVEVDLKDALAAHGTFAINKEFDIADPKDKTKTYYYLHLE